MASIVVAGDTSGTVTLAAPAVSGTTTLTLPTTSGTIVTTSGAQTIEFADGSASTPSITNSGDTNTGMFFPAADTIAFAEGGVEAMRLDASGNVGIGTSSFALSAAGRGDLEIAGSSTAVVGLKGGSNQAYVFNDGTNVYVANASASGNIVFQPATNTERMRIDSSGNVLVKKTAASSSADNNVGIQLGALGKGIFEISGDRALILNRLNDNGIIQEFFRGAGNQVGNIQANTSSVAYNTSSDYRLKENIVPMIGALDKVAQLKPVTYTWKADGSNGQGFIAHELQAIVPDCVTGEKDAVDAEGNPIYQGVDTSFLVATLTAAIQEQQAIINDLKARIETLEAK